MQRISRLRHAKDAAMPQQDRQRLVLNKQWWQVLTTRVIANITAAVPPISSPSPASW